MSIDLSNDMQDAGVINTISQAKTTPLKSEFYEIVDQKNEKNDLAFMYHSNSNQKIKTAYSFDEVKNLSSPELSSMLVKFEKGKTAEELIQEEYKKDTPDGRDQAILLEAMRFGSQSALYNRTIKYQNLLTKSKHELSRIFNFSPLLMMGGRVVPPVISEGSNLEMVNDKFTRTTVKKAYKIISQAKVINTPMDWREYLMFSAPKPSLPSKYALPIKGDEREEKIWINGVSQGWEAGLRQANIIMIQNIRKLERDYVGMVRYHLMLTKKIVTSPIVSNLNLGVTTNADSINIGEVVFEIAELPKFNKDVDAWLALPEIKSPLTFDRLKKIKEL